MKLLRTLLVVLALALLAIADEKKHDIAGAGLQVQQAPAQGQGPEPISPTPKDAPVADRKMTPEEAEKLFRSVDEIAKFASQSTGLALKQPIKRELASREQVQKHIQDRMNEDDDAKRLERSELVMKKLGLLPRDFKLTPFLLELLKEQVAGFYDPKKGTVYLLDWLEPEAQLPVLAHELTHALQDQNFSIEKYAKSARVKDDPDSDERSAARQAVIEGQAMIALIDYMLAPYGQSVSSSPQAVDLMLGAMSTGGDTPLLKKAPPYIRDALVFPYTYGVKFVRDVLASQGKDKAFNGLFQQPPANTRQIMEPKTYLAGEKLAPMPVPDFDKALKDTHKRFDVGTVGQFDAFELIKMYGSVESANAIATHYRGAYAYVAAPKNAAAATPANVGIVFVSRWASPAAAQEFAAVWEKSVKKRYPQAENVTAQPVRPAAKGNGSGQVNVAISDRISGPTVWKTNEGSILIEPRGETVLVMESFEDASSGKLRDAVFGVSTAK